MFVPEDSSSRWTREPEMADDSLIRNQTQEYS
jgi:hypothetical protein